MQEPNIVEKAKNLAGSVANWAVQDGFAKVSPEVFLERKNICQSCPDWDNEAYTGFGKCKLCGCSVAKLYIPSAMCPANPPKWNPTSV